MLASITLSSTIDHMPFEHARLLELDARLNYQSLGRLRGRYWLHRTRALMGALAAGTYDANQAPFCGTVEVEPGFKLARVWQFDDQEDTIGHTQVIMAGIDGSRPRINALHQDMRGGEMYLCMYPYTVVATDRQVGREVITALSGLSKIVPER